MINDKRGAMNEYRKKSEVLSITTCRATIIIISAHSPYIFHISHILHIKINANVLRQKSYQHIGTSAPKKML